MPASIGTSLLTFRNNEKTTTTKHQIKRCFVIFECNTDLTDVACFCSAKRFGTADTSRPQSLSDVIKFSLL